MRFRALTILLAGSVAAVALVVRGREDVTRAPLPPTRHWVSALTPNTTVALRLPPGYGSPTGLLRSDGLGCWHTGDYAQDREQVREFCVRVVDQRGIVPLSLEGGVPWNARSSCSPHYVRGLRSRRMMVNRRQVLAQAARVSDNVLGLGARRTVLVHVELGAGWWAVVSGAAGDDAGLRELLAIAMTVQTGPVRYAPRPDPPAAPRSATLTPAGPPRG